LALVPKYAQGKGCLSSFPHFFRAVENSQLSSLASWGDGERKGRIDEEEKHFVS
jgi:hypothetical protein